MTDPPGMLVIDDNPVIGQFLSRLGASLALRCDVTTTAERFLELLRPETSLIWLCPASMESNCFAFSVNEAARRQSSS